MIIMKSRIRSTLIKYYQKMILEEFMLKVEVGVLAPIFFLKYGKKMTLWIQTLDKIG